MTAHTPRFRGVADGNADGRAHQRSRRLLRLPGAGEGDRDDLPDTHHDGHYDDSTDTSGEWFPFGRPSAAPQDATEPARSRSAPAERPSTGLRVVPPIPVTDTTPPAGEPTGPQAPVGRDVAPGPATAAPVTRADRSVDVSIDLRDPDPPQPSVSPLSTRRRARTVAAPDDPESFDNRPLRAPRHRVPGSAAHPGADGVEDRGRDLPTVLPPPAVAPSSPQPAREGAGLPAPTEAVPTWAAPTGATPTGATPTGATPPIAARIVPEEPRRVRHRPPRGDDAGPSRDTGPIEQSHGAPSPLGPSAVPPRARAPVPPGLARPSVPETPPSGPLPPAAAPPSASAPPVSRPPAATAGPGRRSQPPAARPHPPAERQHPPAERQGPDAAEAETRSAAVAARAGARHRATTAPAVRHTRMRTGALVAGIAAVLVPTLLWAGGGGLADLASPASAVESVGRLARMVGWTLLLVLVVLFAGIPSVEQALGRARVARWQGVVATVSMSLVAAHVFLAVAASALVEGDSVFEAAWRLVSDFPGATLAAVGVSVLVAVLLAWRRAARQPGRPRSRTLLQVYGFAGILLTLPYQVLGSSSLAEAVYWFVLYALATSLVLVWRVYEPLARSLRHQLVVDGVVVESDRVVSVRARGRRVRELGARPGSVLQLRLLDGRGWPRQRVGVVSAACTDTGMRLTVPTDADGARRLGALAPGTWLLVDGPHGAVTAESRQRRAVAGFAAGAGIAQIRGLLDDAEVPGTDATVVHRVHDADAALFRDEMAHLGEDGTVRTVYLDGPRSPDQRSWLPGSAAHVGDSDAVLHLVPDIAERDVFVSGPPGWVDLVVQALRAAGVPDRQVHADSLAP